MAITALTILAITTVLNGWLCQRLRHQMAFGQVVLVTIFSAMQGLMFVGTLKRWTVAEATIAYDVVVVLCWYGLLIFRNEGGGWIGRIGLGLIAVGVLLAGR